MQRSLVLLGALAMALLIAGTGHATSQEWYLTKDPHPTVGDALLLWHTPPENGRVEIPVGTCTLWSTAFPAQQTLPLLQDGWLGHLPARPGSVLPTPVSYPAVIGAVDPGTGFTPAVEADVRFEEASQDRMLGLLNDQAGEQATWDLPEGGLLGLELCNLADLRGQSSDEEPGAMVLEVGPASTLTTPASQTSVPTPELTTLILTLTGVATIVVVRRRGG